MKILVAPDKFKGCLEATQVGEAMAEGVRRCDPTLEIISFPLADGGEGTMSLLTHHSGGQWITCTVSDPLFRPVSAAFGYSGDGTTAFIEMAQASGLQRLVPSERNPGRASSFGTGELIRQALARGVNHLILAVGGSATNDGGIGMAAALGYRFLDAAGQELAPIGDNLIHIERIDGQQVCFDRSRLRVQVACDVDNPLTGLHGASAVYGPQKGATPQQIAQLDAGLRHLAKKLQQQYNIAIEHLPGAGAAGGMGAGAVAFLGAQLTPGAALVMAYTGLTAHLRDADLVLTGEGSLDHQTLRGKIIKELAAQAALYDVSVIAVGGSVTLTLADIQALGLGYAGSILQQPCSLEESIRTAYEAIADCTGRVLHLYLTGYRQGRARRN